ncbi:MAG: hypothetical protein JO071_05085 [Deltaproteobacteria bacterium]|nr:hypothetical protein [Deltaproteobacteria bacterium]
MHAGSVKIIASLLVATGILLLTAIKAGSIDFYEIQIYSTETTPPGILSLELHSNSTISATGAEAQSQLDPYQIHETLEGTYGLTPHIEIGQYFATAKLNNGNYEYSGSRTKCHFGVSATDSWPIKFGGNVELDYMRRAAEEQPLTLEMRPIVETSFAGFLLIANLAFEKPFRGPGTHQGVTFAPSGQISYQLLPWLAPAVEYYGDMGAIEHLPSVQEQQHFLVPAINLYTVPQLEVNAGAGFGLTRASNGVFLKAILGWDFEVGRLLQ